jgi:hypothetical protein
MKHSKRFLHGARASSGPEHPPFRGFTITHTHKQSVGLILMRDRPLPHNTHHLPGTYLNTSGGIRNHSLRKREAAEPRLRPRGHWYKQYSKHFHGWYSLWNNTPNSEYFDHSAVFRVVTCRVLNRLRLCTVQMRERDSSAVKKSS